MKLRVDTGHEAPRRKHYPTMEEFADALYWKARGNPALFEEWLRRCDEVKARFPKKAQGASKDGRE